MSEDRIVVFDDCRTLVDVLRRRAEEQPSARAYTFLSDSEDVAESWTWLELDARARALGAELAAAGAAGERVLLLFPPGLDFVAGFLGCLYAGAVAVPAYPPRSQRTLPRLVAIARDARPVVAATTSALLPRIAQTVPELGEMRVIATDRVDAAAAGAWRHPGVDGASLAFLQYTSGSTSLPKGVRITHGNLMHNESLIRRGFGHEERAVIVSWLPLYHDMGLIGGVLHPLYLGTACYLMSPMAFLQRPMRWLEAISRYRATTSGGPNFAYELCVERSREEDRAALDLSSWKVAFNGSEPVRASTLEGFARAFAPSGFDARAFFPCYGLAEATLYVTGSSPARAPEVRSFDAAALAADEAVESDGEASRALVGSGRSPAEQRVEIVDPETLRPCPEGRVGEIWVSGPSVAEGYWNRPEMTAHDFGARIAGREDPAPFLRTGDLGFLRGGELFVTGRIKDLIIVRGRNVYPQDVELTAERSHPALRPDGGAAFAIEVGGEERVALVHELDRRAAGESEQVAEAIRQAVAAEHEIRLHEVVLIRPQTLPRTSSGKIQRHGARRALLDGTLHVVGRSALAETESPAWREVEIEAVGLRRLAPAERERLVSDYLRQEVARGLRVDPARIAPEQPLTALGLDSLSAVELRSEIESRLGVEVALADLLAGASLEELTRTILEAAAAEQAGEALPALARAEKGAVRHPLSREQAALWYLDRLEPGHAAYVIAGAARVRGSLDVEALRRSFAVLLERHPALRTVFGSEQGEPYQEVRPVPPGAEWFEEVEAGRADLSRHAFRPFDLTRGPLLRVVVVRQGPGEPVGAGEHVIVLSVHHVVADFWSLGVLLAELGVLYRQGGRPAVPLEPPALAYTDYARWQARLLASRRGESLLEFWRRRLAGNRPALALATDRPRPPVQTFRGGSQILRLDEETAEALLAVGRAHGATLYTTLLAVFVTLLYRYTGQRDFLVGSPTAGRGDAGLRGLVGYFVNPVPLRCDLSGRPSFEELLTRTRETLLAALEHRDLPFVELVKRLPGEHDPSRSPLFQVMFALQQGRTAAEEGLAGFALGEDGALMRLTGPGEGGLTLESVALEQRSAQFDLTLVMARAGGRLAASLQYNTDLFEAATAGRLLAHFHNLARAASAGPGLRLAALPLLTAGERREILGDWQGEVRPYELDRSVDQLFEAVAAARPDALAVSFRDRRWSYGALNRRANRIAHHLRACGVGPDVPVGLFVERGFEMVAGALGILKAGGAYVPIDPAYPDERVAFMVADTGMPALLTQQHLRGRLTESRRLEVLALDGSGEALLRGRSEGDSERTTDPEQLAYVIFTSGSTGRPKGVGVRHAGLLNLVSWHRRVYGPTPRDHAAQVAAPAFDATVWELWPYLASGTALHVVDDATRLSPPALLDWLAREAVTLCFLPTPLAEAVLLEPLPAGLALRALLTGGDKLHKSPAEELPFPLLNHYGPTESSVVSTWTEVEWGVSSPPIGRPLHNTRVYLLDRCLELVPAGVPGELAVGGASLARGYRGRPRLTAEKFVPDPLSATEGARLYLTGDLARYRPDGLVEFLGRIDTQVQVRGFRVELGEIEAVLAEIPAVRECAVVMRDDLPGGPRLVGYVVPAAGEAAADGAPGSPEALRARLQERLPEYMVPAAFVFLDALPLTPNDKVDRRALPRPPAGASGKGSVSPRTDVEKRLAEIFSELLELDQVGIHDHFFELGGHSLLATRLLAKVRDAFGVEIALRQLFEAPTIAAAALLIESSRSEAAATATTARPGIRRVSREGFRVDKKDLAKAGVTIERPGS